MKPRRWLASIIRTKDSERRTLMGLDISYFSEIEIAPDDIEPDCDEPVDYDKYIWLYLNPDFDGRHGNIVDGARYTYKHAERFRAGSYSGYNAWRETLAELAGYEKVEIERFGFKKNLYAAYAWLEPDKAGSLPFYELINFSDCEGVIGSEVSAKLAGDFNRFRDEAHNGELTRPLNPRFCQIYDSFLNAFTVASNNGAVKFA